MNFLDRLGRQAFARSHPTENRSSSIKSYYQQVGDFTKKTAKKVERGARKVLRMRNGGDAETGVDVIISGYDDLESLLLQNRAQFNTIGTGIWEGKRQLSEIVRKESSHDLDFDDEGFDVQSGQDTEYVHRKPLNQFSGSIPTSNESIRQAAAYVEEQIEHGIERAEPFRFRVFSPLPIISAEIPSLKGTLLRFFKSYWSLIMLYLSYGCALAAELAVAHLNAVFLLGFDPVEGWLFAGVMVAISYVMAKILLPQVQRLLGETKNRLNSFWWSYIVAVVLLVGAFGFLSYERLQDRTKTDQALVTSEELNNLHIAKDAFGGKDVSFQDLIDQKQLQLNQLLAELTQGQSTAEKWAARIALILAGLIGLMTSSILIAAIKIIGTTAKAYQSIKRGQRKLDKLYTKDEEILGRLLKAQDMICSLGFLTLKIQILEDLLAMPLSDADFAAPEDHLSAEDIEEKLNSIPDYETASQGNPFDLMP